jgi:hypothetical protein
MLLPTLMLMLGACTGDQSTSQSSNSGESTSNETNSQPSPTSQTSSPTQSPGTYAPSIVTSIRMQIPDTVGAKGQTLCLDVRVGDFQKILSMQYSLNWQPKVLKFINLQNFSLENLSESNFGLKQVSEGKIGLSWYDPAVKGLTLPNGQSIYQICFDLVGAAGSESRIQITSDPVLVEVSNSQERILGIPTGKGRVVIR